MSPIGVRMWCDSFAALQLVHTVGTAAFSSPKFFATRAAASCLLDVPVRCEGSAVLFLQQRTSLKHPRSSVFSKLSEQFQAVLSWQRAAPLPCVWLLLCQVSLFGWGTAHVSEAKLLNSLVMTFHFL